MCLWNILEVYPRRRDVMNHFHAFSYSGHDNTKKTVAKILQIGFYWPNLFKYMHSFIKRCDQCQHTGNIFKRNEMPLNNILEVEIFDFWGIDFMRPFPSSMGNQYILILVDYVSKWIEETASSTNDAWVVSKMFKKVIFSWFGFPRLVISDMGSHFIARKFVSILKKYRVTYMVATPYHPQTGGHIEASDKEI